MAERIGWRVQSEKVDHMPLVTAPGSVAEVIFEAVPSWAA
jgi:hypothetical protein